MASVILIKDRENKPYALVEIGSEGTAFYPVVEAAKKWSSWMAEEFAGKKIKKDELVQTIDNSMSLETSVSESTVEELKNRSLNKPDNDTKYKNADLLPVVSVMDVQLSEFSVDLWRNAVQYKAVAFIADQTKSSMLYEVKRARGVWDPSLAVPGTSRRGGFRCPVGTRYGGQITDRFGRNCGWGVARRLANEISDLGERLENVGDARRERRVNRRNERVARRLAQGGAIERGARAVGDALDLTGMGGRQGGRRNRTGDVDAVKPGRVERAAGRIADIVNPDTPTRSRRAPARRPRPDAPQLGGMLDENGRVMPVGGGKRPAARPRPAARRPRPNLRESEERRMDREINEPGAARTGPQLGGMLDENGRVMPVGGETRPAARPRPAAPRRPANPRPARPRNVPVDNTSGVPVPAGAPSARESLDTYKTRKYNEHQAEVRRIREQGGNAGFLRRSEWERYHGPVVEQAWRDRNPTAANAGRGRRRDATGQNAGRAATRRPRPAPAPAPAPARPRPAPAPAPARPRPAPATTLLTEERLRNLNDSDLEQRRVVAEEMVRALDAAGWGAGVQRQPRERLQKILNEQRRRILSPARPAPAPAAPARPRPAAPARPRPAAPARPRPARPARPRPANAAAPASGENTLRPAGVRPRIGEGRLNDNRGVGRLPSPHVILNSNIQNKQQAIQHIKDGGDLDEVPHLYWHDAVSGNLRTPQNPTGRFKELKKNGGIIGDTEIYVMVDAQGKKTNRGWVFKAARTSDNMNELMGWNLAGAHGFDVEGAHLDGKHRNNKRFVILPFASQNIPEDWRELPAVGEDVSQHHGKANFQVENLNDLPDRAYPQRTRQFVFNYLLGVGDRHGQNGWGKVYEKPDGTKVAHVLPIDLGWVGRDAQNDPVGYLRNYRMEQASFRSQNARNWPQEMKQHLAGLAPAERAKQRDAIVKAVDDMITEGRQIARMSNAEVRQFAERMLPTDFDAAARTDALNTAVEAHRTYVAQHQKLIQQRTRLLDALVG